MGNRTYLFYLLHMTILDRFPSGSHLLANVEYQQRCQCSIWVLKRADWVKLSSSFASQWTKNRSFCRRSSQPISQHCTEETKPNATKANNTETMQSKLKETSGYATMVHGRGCNPHRCTTTFANVDITSLWRHNSETVRDRQKWRPHCCMKSSELSNGENRIALLQLLQNQKLRHWWRHNLGSRWKLQKNGSREF